MLRLSISVLSAVLLLGAPQLRADGLSAAELLKEVENCSLKLTGEGPPIDAEAEAMIVKVGEAVLAKGVSAHLFYVSPGKDGKPDDFGLILDATPAQVAKALPRFAKPKDVNGYLRDLEPIGDPDGTGNGQEKTLLVCRAGAA
jgi:hypothetical protein